MIVAYIDEHRERVVEGRRLGVEPICEVLRSAGVQIAPSGYYATKTRPPSARAVRDAELVPVIRKVHTDNIVSTEPARSGPSSTARAMTWLAAPSSG